MTNETPPPPSGAPLDGPPPPSPAAGTAHALLPVGDWLTDTTRALARGFGDFFAVLTVVSLVSTAVSAPLIWLSSSDAVLVRDDQGAFTTIEGMSGGQGVMAAVGLITILVSQVLLFTGATNHIDRVRAGEPPRWQETMALLATRGLRVIGVVLQVMLAGFVLLVVAGVLGGVGLGAVAGLLAVGSILLLWVRSAIASTHAALDGRGGSVGTSVAWTKGRTWPLLGRHILLLAICVGLLLISSLIAAPFQSLSGAAAPLEGDLVLRDVIGSSVPAFVAVQFINALTSGLVAALWASGMLSLYRGQPAAE